MFFSCSSMDRQKSKALCLQSLACRRPSRNARGYEKWPCQVLLSVGDGGWFLFSGAMTEENDWFKSRVGNNWIAGDNLLFNYGNPWKVEWRPAVWNSACIAMSTRAQLI